MHWESLVESIYLFRDSCNVYAVQAPEALIVINAGTGRASANLKAIAHDRPVFVLLTHHFRDHTDGAIRFKEAGATILCPYWEKDYLLDPEQHFRERQTWNSYDNRWDRFSPVRPIPIDGLLLDYETRNIGGSEWKIIPTPGQTNGAITLKTIVNGRAYLFCGELITGIGKTGRVAPLQYDYNDMWGAVNLFHSATVLEWENPDVICPSLGTILETPRTALRALKENLSGFGEINSVVAPYFLELPCDDDIEEVLPHLYRSKHAVSETHFLISESGKILAIDFGYSNVHHHLPIKSHLSNRRPYLHSVNALEKKFGIAGIDTLLLTHYHDDHVNGAALLQRLYGTKLWVADLFADLLENPAAYDRPCLWHQPVTVDHRLPVGRTFFWEEYPIILFPMSGHTRFSTLICLEVDDTRVAHTGDQIFFNELTVTLKQTSVDPGRFDFRQASLFTNHVYKNGVDLGCFGETLEYLTTFRPKLILSGHMKPYAVQPAWYSVIEKGAKRFDALHSKLMAISEDDVHFGIESQAAILKPYRVHLPNSSGLITFRGSVLNPFGQPAKANLAIVVPDGWLSPTADLLLGPKQWEDFLLQVRPPPDVRCRRQPVALDLTINQRPFGQVCEALITIGHTYF